MRDEDEKRWLTHSEIQIIVAPSATLVQDALEISLIKQLDFSMMQPKKKRRV
jgi:hypothetical protein